MACGNAHIGKPAPDFHATAIVDGAIKELKLSDYKGMKWLFSLDYLKLLLLSCCTI